MIPRLRGRPDPLGMVCTDLLGVCQSLLIGAWTGPVCIASLGPCVRDLPILVGPRTPSDAHIASEVP